ncbi:MAG: DUF4292 domain-containing protein [Bacteroidota bacterium]
MYIKRSSPTFFIYILIIIILPLFFGCKPTKEIAKTTVKRRSTKYLLEQLQNNELNYEWLSAKFSASAIINDKKHSFVARLRIRKDSAIWVSASLALGIEIARVCITKDSLKFINRLNSTYFTGSINYLDQLILTDFDILQSLLTGNSFISMFDNFNDDKEDKLKSSKEDKIRSSIDNEHYLLGTFKKRKLRRTIEGKRYLLFTAHSIWLDPVTYKITAQKIQEPPDRILKANYIEFKEVDTQLFPHKIDLCIKDEHTIDVSLNFSKILLNEPQKLLFSIPEKYERIF